MICVAERQHVDLIGQAANGSLAYRGGLARIIQGVGRIANPFANSERIANPSYDIVALGGERQRDEPGRLVRQIGQAADCVFRQ